MHTPEQIEEWVAESGLAMVIAMSGHSKLTRFAALVAQHERERMAPCMAALKTIAAQSSGKVCSTALADCMAAIAAAAIRNSDGG